MKDEKANKTMKDKKSKNYKNKTKDKKASEVKLSRVLYHYWKYARNYKWWFLISILLSGIGKSIFMVGTPYISKLLIDSLNNNGSNQEINIIFWYLLGSFVLSSLFLRTATYISNKYGVIYFNDLIKYVFRQILDKDLSFFENSFVGGLVNKMDKFVLAAVATRDGFIKELFVVVVQVASSIGIIFWVDSRIGIIFFVWCIVYIFITSILLRYKMKIDYIKAQTISKRIGVTADAITNISNVKTFSAWNKESKYHGDITDESRDAVLHSWTLDNIHESITATLFLILEFFAVGLTIKLWAQGVLSVGDVVLIQSYFMLFLSALWSISKVLKSALQAFSDAKEMVEILDQEVEVQDIKGAKKLKVSQGEIIFQDTVFSYPNQKENVFNKFNLTIPAGQTVGLVGTSGAGKTTITKILLRFLDLDSGKILIDKQDISKITQDSLRNSISYVPQEPVLFHRSIYENIAYAKPGATEKEVLEAAKKSYVDEFVQTLEQGYDTMVGERGVKLSGGQKQRVAIARAFLKNAPILVLDEATSALDSVSEELIQDALFKLMKDKTVIIVAHRLSTIQRLDRILVIEEGKIVEDGTHQELLQKKNGLYTDFWKKQTRIFE
jgi:ATP-binding cassette subfamily B protein